MKKILIVEDEPNIRNVIMAYLEANRLDALLAINGQEGLDLWQERSQEIDLVVTDITMPRLNGFRMISQAREKNLMTPVIIFTGLTNLDNHDLDMSIAKNLAIIKKPDFLGLIKKILTTITD